MIRAEEGDSQHSSSESDTSQGRKDSAVPEARQGAGRQNGQACAASAEKAEADNARGRRGTGGGVGLSPLELQEMHKNDPKRVKRILANRSSAARSKVRKLRYIAELESRSASLQEKASSLLAELEGLHDQAMKLSKENEELFGQAYGLQDHMQNQEVENKHLMQQMSQLRAMEAQFLRPHLGNSLTQAQQQSMRPPVLEPNFPAPANLQDLQDDQLPSLQFPRRPMVAQQFPQLSSFASVASMFQNPNKPPAAFNEGVSPDLNMDMTPHYKSEASLNNADLSGSGGVSVKSQQSTAVPDMDSGLMELLSLNPELDTTPKPCLPVPRWPIYGRPVDEGMLSVGLPGGLPSLDSSSSQSELMHGLRSLPSPHQHMLLEAGRHRSVSSGASSYSNFITSRLTAPPNPTLEGMQDLQGTAQGLRRWPRHFSDPQGFNSGFQFQGF